MYADLRNRGPNYRKAYERRNRRRLEKFLADPEGEYAAPYTASKSFGWELLLYCANWVARDPRAGRDAARKSHDFFLRFAQDRKRVPKRRALAHCQRYQALGIMAAADRALGKAKKAENRLRLLLGEVKCPACQADLHRRLAIALRDERRFLESLAEMEHAVGLYRRLGDSGHDLFQSGPAACLYGRATIHYYRGDFTAGAQDAARSLALIDRNLAPDLHRWALSAAAACAIKLVRFHPENKRLLDDLDRLLADAAGSIEPGGPSVELGKLLWLRGMVAFLRQDLDSTESFLSSSQDILIGKEDSSVAAVTADLIFLCGLRARIERAYSVLLRLSYGRRGRCWFKWLPKSYRNLLDVAAEAVCTSDSTATAAIAKRLRSTLDFTEMPSFFDLGEEAEA